MDDSPDSSLLGGHESVVSRDSELIFDLAQENGEEKNGDGLRESHESDSVGHQLFTLSGDNNLLSVEGEGLAEIVESRGEVLLAGLWRCVNSLLCSFPCCIVWKSVYYRTSILRSRSQFEQYKSHSALSQTVWPPGFGPGWVIRTFCPLILLVWCLGLYHGAFYGPKLFDSLESAISAPSGSPSLVAQELFAQHFFLTATEDFPTQTLFVIERLDGSSVLTPEIEIFCTFMNRALHCGEVDGCPNHLEILDGIYNFDGYYMQDSEAARRSVAPLFVNGDSSATVVYMKHSIKHFINPNLFDFLEDFIDRNGPNKHLYRVMYANEQSLLNIAQTEVVYDFEHADLIGIPFAWLILFWYCGFSALLVLVSLPICTLLSFSMTLVFMPKGLSLPSFAPSLIVSMSVALNVDYALFMMVRYSEEIRRGNSRNFALDKAMSTAGKTIAVSGSIMLMSNGCLYFVNAETVASLGVALAVTNLVTILTNLTLLPALLYALGPVLETLRNANWPSVFDIGSIFKKISPRARQWYHRLFCFRSGRRKGRVKVMHHSLPRFDNVNDVDVLRQDIETFDSADRVDKLYLKDDTESVSKHTGTPFLNFHGLDDNATGDGAVGDYNCLESAATIRSSTLDEDSLQLDSASHVVGSGNGRADEDEVMSRDQERKIRESSNVLSTQSWIWAFIAKMCITYPKSICVIILTLCLPLCVQVYRFTFTDSQANILPSENVYVQSISHIGSIGLNQGYLGDYKGIVAPPMGISAQYQLERGNCFDNDVVLDSVKQYVEKVLEYLNMSHGLPDEWSCESLGNYARKRGIFDSFCSPILRLGEYSSIIINHCPYTCDTCRAELVSSKEYFAQVRSISDIVVDVSMKFATINQTAGGGYARVQAPMLESLSFFHGRYYDWEQARKLLAFSGGVRRRGDATDDLYVKHVNTMIGWNATHHLIRIRPPFHPYNRDGHPFVTKLRDVMQKTGFDYFGDSSKHRFIFGGSVVALFDQVDAVYKQTPPIMCCAIILTVLAMSLLVFQSLLLGPRLLITVALTIGLTFGAMVIIFQDLGKSPDSAGMYWIVPILSIPIMVGCTLDYDSFVVARIFEIRLSSLSTEAAVFAGLQETSHVITIAGIIMTVAFGSMIFSAIPVIQQIGAVLVCCCLLDTFVVRSLLVPVLILIGEEYNWYPKRMPPVQVTMESLRLAIKRSARKSKERRIRRRQARIMGTDSSNVICPVPNLDTIGSSPFATQ